MTQNYGNQNAHDGDSIFENVFIYGKLHYDFDGDTGIFKDLQVDTLKVLKNSEFIGVATFRDDVFIEGKLDTEFALVRQRLDVGIAGTVLSADANSIGRVGIANTFPIHRFQVGGPNTSGTPIPGFPLETEDKAFIVSSDGTVGIGTTDPLNFPSYSASHGALKMVAAGSIKIDRNIYDSADSVGFNGYYLKRDGEGIRWAEASPIAMEGIYVQDEGNYLPTVGTAQTFSTINFVQTNSLGIGTDTVVAIPDPDNPTDIARIQTSDLWGYTTAGDINSPIYRMSKVGIKNALPDKELDVSGEVHVTGNVDFDADLNVDGNQQLDGTLNVDGATTLNNTLDVDLATRLRDILQVDGATELNDTLDVDGKATFNDITEATSTTSASVQIDGGVGIVKKLFVGDDTKIESVTQSTNTASGALVVGGGAGIGLNLHVGGLGRINSNTTSNSTTSGALVVTGGTGIGENLWVGGYALSLIHI